MSAEVFPVFNPRVPAASFDVDGKLLLHEHTALDAIARQLNLNPLTSFGDNREVPDDFVGDLEELDELLGEWDEWFPIATALKTIDGLADAIENNPDIAAQLQDPESIRYDLRGLANCLRTAQAEDALFRLEVG